LIAISNARGPIGATGSHADRASNPSSKKRGSDRANTSGTDTVVHESRATFRNLALAAGVAKFRVDLSGSRAEDDGASRHHDGDSRCPAAGSPPLNPCS
jgi:hypothetical protein